MPDGHMTLKYTVIGSRAFAACAANTVGTVSTDIYISLHQIIDSNLPYGKKHTCLLPVINSSHFASYNLMQIFPGIPPFI